MEHARITISARASSVRRPSVRLNPSIGLFIHRRQSRSSLYLYPQPRSPLTVPVRKHGQSSGETYVTTLTLHKAFKACQTNKSAWLQRRDELTQVEQAYREQLAGSAHGSRSLQTLREIIDVKSGKLIRLTGVISARMRRCSASASATV